MKKNSLVLALACLPFLGFGQAKHFTIKGELKDQWVQGKVFLSYKTVERKVMRDSIDVKQGKFAFKGQLNEPVLAQLSFRRRGSNPGPKGEYTELYIYDTVATVQVDKRFEVAHIDGGGIQQDYLRYAEILAPVNAEISRLNKKFNDAPNRRETAFIDSMKNAYEDVSKERKRKQQAFFEQHPNSYFALAALNDVAGTYFDANVIEPEFKRLAVNWQSVPTAQALKGRIVAAKKTANGTVAPLFELPDVDRKPIRLADFRGKYVLIDFWASWCGPCREENPHVREAYEQFKPKGLEIIGISLDKASQKQAWLKAIKDDQLPWIQVSDLAGWNSSVAQLYAVKAIPQNFLIDPSGKIVASNLRGKELEAKLNEFLSK